MDIYSVLNLTCRKCYDMIDRHRLISILEKGTDDTGFFNPVHRGWTLVREGRADPSRKESVLSPLLYSIYLHKPDREP